MGVALDDDGVLDDGHTTIRPPGMPLEENGLVTSYQVGRDRQRTGTFSRWE